MICQVVLIRLKKLFVQGHRKINNPRKKRRGVGRSAPKAVLNSIKFSIKISQNDSKRGNLPRGFMVYAKRRTAYCRPPQIIFLKTPHINAKNLSVRRGYFI